MFRPRRGASSSGRQRFNVLGALHAITHQLITVTNDSYINASSVCELLEKIAALGLSTPVTVVMDNARYQRCRLVLERATQLGEEHRFLAVFRTRRGNAIHFLPQKMSEP